MAGHTPKWTTGEIDRAPATGYLIPIFNDAAPTGSRMPAEVYGANPNEVAQRARLIASAPDTLQALECLVHRCDAEGVVAWAPLTAARAAIAAATEGE